MLAEDTHPLAWRQESSRTSRVSSLGVKFRAIPLDPLPPPRIIFVVEKKLLNGVAWKQIFEFISDFPPALQAGWWANFSQLRSWATFHAQLHNITSPFCLGPSALQAGTRARLYFFYCFNGWFSVFLSSGIEMHGLPLCSSCNTSFKVIYLAKLTIFISNDLSCQIDNLL